MKIVFICSTNASVVKQALQSDLLNDFDIEFVSDRLCGAIDFAKAQGFSYKVLEAKDGKEFSALLSDVYSNNDDNLFISFYTRLLTNPFLNKQMGRLINFHPSILPACPGMDGFGDTIQSGAMFVGSTVHFIDSGIDTGFPILQGAFPKNISLAVNRLRHRVFLQQVISLIQVTYWFKEQRVKLINGQCYISNAEYNVSEFSPNLDQELQKIYESWLKELL